MADFFRGKVVIVTGSSNGIGRATARLFAEKGAKLTITGRNAETLQETKSQCLSAGLKESDILEVIADLEVEYSPTKIINETIDTFGQIDVLVNNAGMVIGDLTAVGKPPTDAAIVYYDRMMNVNTRSVILLCQLATPYLEKMKGSIVNVSSIAGFPFSSHSEIYYPITKAALDQLTVQLAGNLISKGIRVNSVNPGVVETDIVSKLGMSKEMAKKVYDMHAKDMNALPLGRCGEPDDIGKVIVFLADKTQSEFIVGQRIVVDGGSLIKNSLLSKEFPKEAFQ